MKFQNKNQPKLNMLFTSHCQIFKNLILSSILLIGFQFSANAQNEGNVVQVPQVTQTAQFTRPSWWFGVAAGANFNFYRGSIQELNASFTPPIAFQNGNGIGLYLAPLIEYHRPNSILGIMLQIGYDSRNGKFNQGITPCNCPADLSTNLSYITIEPNLRITPFKNNFYIYGGPRFAFNMNKSFTYKLGKNPGIPDQLPNPAVTGELSNINNTIISMQIGVGYDIPITSQNKKTQFVLSPFVSIHPYFGQDARSIETWNITTLRAGMALKFGFGRKKMDPSSDTKSDQDNKDDKDKIDPIAPNDIIFTINSPLIVAEKFKVREIFPLRNYIFFDEGSNKIPERYVMLRKDQVKDFKENQVELTAPKNLSGRSDRQMIVYYNVLNILGDRMVKNPSTNANLVGSSKDYPENGQEIALSVKEYLVTIFGINANRITTEGIVNPKISSENTNSKTDILLREDEGRRVSIESNSPVLLLEYNTGKDVPLKQVEIVAVEETPIESFVSFNVKGADKAFTSWSLEIADEYRKIQYFGPYGGETIRLPGKSILGKRPSGKYIVTMKGNTKNGEIIKKEALMNLEILAPSKNVEIARFSILYEFNNSEAILMYEKYLMEVVVPRIPEGSSVLIHGYTDIIGDSEINLNLSQARANDVMKILMRGLANKGKKVAKIEAIGLGEDNNLSPFSNKYPEERYYNRIVRIDVIPKN